jgi:hypothetical protein
VPIVQPTPLHGVAHCWHVPPWQTDCPGAPQPMHVPVVQPGPLHGIANGWHWSPVAHTTVPGKPQATQVPIVQPTPLHGVAHCWHVFPGQTGCAGAPHAWQVLLLHMEPVPHCGGVVQQNWLAPPHATHVPGMQLASGHCLAPGLHGGLVVHWICPGAPHPMHLPRLQTPALHAGVDGQQSCCGPPHAIHWLAAVQ